MKLIVVSNSDKPVEEEDIIAKMFADRSIEESAIVTKMFENGLQTFHLRKPEYSSETLKEYLIQIPSIFHNRIILHSHHHLAGKFLLKGIHINKSDINKVFKTKLKLWFFRINNPRLMLTTSYSKPSKLFEKESFFFNYVFLSPIFNNITGVLISRIQENTLKAVLLRTSHKVIARGGISVEKVGQVHDLGFAGMAVHSSIWKKQDPLGEFIAFKNKFKELNIELE